MIPFRAHAPIITRRKLLMGLSLGLPAAAFAFVGSDRPSVLDFDPRHLQPTPLSETEMSYARTAWRYFSTTTNTKTGLVPSAFNFASTTMWDQGGYLNATVAAARLGIISTAEAHSRLKLVLRSLAALPLFDGAVPNKAYDIDKMQMTDYANKPSLVGLGYSALDIMRLLGAVKVALAHFPNLRGAEMALLHRWQLDRLHHKGRLSGQTENTTPTPTPLAEGRIGYEQYGARIGVNLGLPVHDGARYDLILRWQRYFDIYLPGDQRSAQTDGVSSITTSEPFLLDALEFGWHDDAIPVAMAALDAQMYRYARTGILTALSEDHIKGPPYFAYHAILEDQRPFVSVTSKRHDVSDKRCLSTKASFGWWALTAHPYCQTLLAAVAGLRTDKGWYAGRYESDGSVNKVLTLNTNAIVLEALHYRAFGPLLAL